MTKGQEWEAKSPGEGSSLGTVTEGTEAPEYDREREVCAPRLTPSGLEFAKESHLSCALEGWHSGAMYPPRNKFHSVGPAACFHLCSRETHKPAWPVPDCKQRKRPCLAYHGLFLFALDTAHGPSWLESLLFWKGPLVFKVGAAGSPLPWNERSPFWALCQPSLGTQREASSQPPLSLIRRDLSPSPRHSPRMAMATPHWVAINLLSFPVTLPAHTTWQRDLPLPLAPGVPLLTARRTKTHLWLKPENLLWT